MELPVSSSLLRAVSRASLCPNASQFSFNRYFLRLNRRKLKCNNSKSLRIELCLDQNSSAANVYGDSKFVEVIGIGSRKDAVLDFCLGSPLLSRDLRFWNINVKDSVNVELQQRVLGEDIPPSVVEAPSTLQSRSKALILVAGAAYGSEYMMVLDILKTVKPANGLVVGIILKPFSFEGRRRRSEVKDLADKLQELTNFCIMIDTDTLLEKDALTLDEALKTANNATLTAMNCISILVSEMHTKFLDVTNETVKELKVSEMKKLLATYRDAKIGFGTGYNIKTSIMRSVYECPFFGIGVKDMSTIALCLTSSGAVESNDVEAVLLSFRQAAKFKGAIIMSIVHEPKMESNLIAATVIALGYVENEESGKEGIFSRLIRHLPSIFNLWGKLKSQSLNKEESGLRENGRLSEVISSPNHLDMPSMPPANDTTDDFDIVEVDMSLNSDDKLYSLSSISQSETEPSELDSDPDYNVPYDPLTKGEPKFHREQLFSRQNIGHAQDWSTEEVNNYAAAALMPENLGIFRLPIGVKRSDELKEDRSITFCSSVKEDMSGDDINTEPQVSPNVPWDALTDASLEAVTELYSNASAMLKRNNADVSKKKGNLSARAASMLESERDSSKKWSPQVQIKYRGGLYTGRCQGGLPEGKGLLVHEDGSTYDGMWRSGKMSGLGTFCFCNGDVFRGSWRDDLMHGKGWLYFHTGDRWFVNFWKGKANGEGRFYSKNGEIFFGRFKDGWRHGHFLCIDVKGERCVEIWDEGVLVSSKQLDSDSD